ncbi:MBL fold metallo-hydrolase [Irregularibacter muris]|uniref:MBL fold metallo-hydrolase n=1 Tax=Irregularibacter muris TaxID=1796619 RepID=A0AAE3HFQ9_9FIRM|nr:MBL fold metallo-hydrolase [Irregularibacter muris]MCR1898204.1 MBL fold metallo-hydrolase [Irregularibacter muris]
MIIETVPSGIYAANCYIIGCEETKEGAIIDPGGDALGLLFKIKKLQLNIKYIILTHGHLDHIGGVNEIKRKTQAAICIHSLDKDMLMDPELNLSKNMGRHIITQPCDIELKDKDVLNIGNISLEIIHTPGHTPGGICILANDSLFSGDTLFAGSVGRTDFPKGSTQDIISSISEKLFTLEDNVVVYPGHGAWTTIGKEKATNPFFN